MLTVELADNRETFILSSDAPIISSSISEIIYWDRTNSTDGKESVNNCLVDKLPIAQKNQEMLSKGISNMWLMLCWKSGQFLTQLDSTFVPTLLERTDCYRLLYLVILLWVL